MSWLDYLKEIGPFSAPLCAVGVWIGRIVIKYLMGVISELKEEIRILRAENDTLRERITAVQVESTKAMGEFGEQMRDRLGDYETALKELTKKTFPGGS